MAVDVGKEMEVVLATAAASLDVAVESASDVLLWETNEDEIMDKMATIMVMQNAPVAIERRTDCLPQPALD